MGVKIVREVEQGRLPKIDLDQWVVKGKEKDKRSYLKRRWNPDGASWMARQSAANRFSRSDAELWARTYGGVPVRLVAPRKVVRQVPALREFICKSAEGSEEKRVLHWIHGVGELEGSKYTEGDCFCQECAAKVVAQLRAKHPKKAEDVDLCVDGGYGSDEDGPRYCELCSKPLQHSLTDYGVEEEFNHFKTCPPEAGAPDVWAHIVVAVRDLADDSPLWTYVAKWVSSAKKRARKA